MTSPGLRITEQARRAPSIHNTQPWQWRVDDHRIDLYADRSRQLGVADPSGRNLVISCGAALEYAEVAARALGWPAETTLMPSPTDPDHLATLDLRPGDRAADAAAQLRMLLERRTDRRRFTSWPIPPERLARLAASVEADRARVVPVTTVVDRVHVELLVSRAASVQKAHRPTRLERRSWVDRSAVDGIPAGLLAASDDRGSAPDDPTAEETAVAEPAATSATIESSDGLLILATDTDSPDAWLRTGQALSRLWLHAMDDGLSVVPLSQVTEVDETREALRHDVLGATLHPHLLVRIGWQEIARSPLPPTPRRPLHEMLVPPGQRSPRTEASAHGER